VGKARLSLIGIGHFNLLHLGSKAQVQSLVFLFIVPRRLRF